MFASILLWGVLILPWFTLFFMKRQAFIRYLPVALFTCVLAMNIYEIAYVYDWWRIETTIVPWGHITNVPAMFGIFFIGTIWIFYFTYRNFWLFMVVNLIVDASLIYVFGGVFEHIGNFIYTQMPRWGALLITLSIAFVIFLFQRWYEARRH